MIPQEEFWAELLTELARRDEEIARTKAWTRQEHWPAIAKSLEEACARDEDDRARNVLHEMWFIPTSGTCSLSAMWVDEHLSSDHEMAWKCWREEAPRMQGRNPSRP